MDHPKCYVGEIKHPRKELIKNLNLNIKNINIYTGLLYLLKLKNFKHVCEIWREKNLF